MPKKLNETEYQAIRAALIGSNVKTAEALEEKIQGMHQSAKKWSLIGAAIAISSLLILPKYAIFFIMICSVYMAWLWSSTINSSFYFKRYLAEIKEEGIQNKGSNTTSDKPATK